MIIKELWMESLSKCKEDQVKKSRNFLDRIILTAAGDYPAGDVVPSVWGVQTRQPPLLCCLSLHFSCRLDMGMNDPLPLWEPHFFFFLFFLLFPLFLFLSSSTIFFFFFHYSSSFLPPSSFSSLLLLHKCMISQKTQFCSRRECPLER